MKLQTSPLNIIPFLNALLQSFSSYAERKKINLVFNSLEDEIIVYIDKDKIEKIFTNILSNAFKFAPEGGIIEAAVKSNSKSSPKEVAYKSVSSPPLEEQGVGQSSNNYVCISIRDTGVGIPKEKIGKIFDRFYQVDGSHTREQEGTGIGLSLTKELVELHKGKIEVESEEGKGATFTIRIPLGKEHLKPEEICEQGLSQTLSKGEGFSEEIIFPKETKTEKHEIDLIAETRKPFLLLVEDNADVRNYIKNNLIEEYGILEAADGVDG